MVDITIKLIWYRLGESYANMADGWSRAQHWYQDFSLRRVDLLDMLFLGWIIAAFLVVGAINLYIRFFGLPRIKRDPSGKASGVLFSGKAGESANWINAAFSWLHRHYESTPEVLDAWLRSINEQAAKQSAQWSVQFDRVLPGATVPKLSHITTDNITDSCTIHAMVDCTDVTLAASVYQSGHLPPNQPGMGNMLMNQHPQQQQPYQQNQSQQQNPRLSNCDVILHKLSGQVRLACQQSMDQIQMVANFTTPPDLKMTVRPRSTQHNIDPKMLEQIIRTAICNSATQVNLPVRGGAPYYLSAIKSDRIEAQQAGHVSSAPNKGSLQGRRLLVKVIKANSLGDRDVGCTDPFCTVSLDNPPQKHTTSIVKNARNPFWDEHFLLDLDSYSREVKFELFDREKPPGEDFMGRAVIPISELRQTPSSRQILPLSGALRNNRPANGTITAEFLFMEPAEAAGLQLNSPRQEPVNLSGPQRRIDTQRTVTPGGTMITTTTTTTERPRDMRVDPHAEGPRSIVKTDSSPSTNRTSSQQQTPGSDNAGSPQAPNDLQAERGRSLGSPRLTVTRPGQSHMMMSESPPPDMRDDTSMISGSTDQREMKKSRSFASAIKKRFSRSKKRSQSADRASSLRGEHLLKPPDSSGVTRTAEDVYDTEIPEGSLRKSRSHSFSNSLKRIFRRKSKSDKIPSSRESSISRGPLGGGSREGSFAPSPSISDRPSTPYMEREVTPTNYQGDYPAYSRSNPIGSPLYDR